MVSEVSSTKKIILAYVVTHTTMSALRERMARAAAMPHYAVQPFKGEVKTGRLPNPHSVARGDHAGERTSDDRAHDERGILPGPAEKIVESLKANPVLLLAGVAVIYYAVTMK